MRCTHTVRKTLAQNEFGIVVCIQLVLPRLNLFPGVTCALFRSVVLLPATC